MDSPLFKALQYITLLGAGQGIFLALLLFWLPRGNRTANRLLAAFLFFFALNIAGIVLFELRLILEAPQLALLYSSFALLFSPFFYLYVLAMTRPDFRLKPSHLLHGLPFVLFIAYSMPVLLLREEEKRQWLLSAYDRAPMEQLALFIASTIQCVLYLGLCFRLLKRHERAVKEFYSDTHRINLHWIRHCLLGLVAVFGACVVFSFFNIRIADTLSNLFFSVLVYAMGVYAIRQPAIFTDLPPAETSPQEEQAPVRYERSALPDHLVKPGLELLHRLMDGEKIYRNPELKLTDLATQLDLSPHYLSQLLNIHVGETFYDYINRRRVEDFKESLADPDKKHMSLLGLAYDAGFNSKASFYNAFKKYTGMTPTEFRQATPA
ncbi:MAG: helix-turn-helix domain-containing protein [Lewinellaceae bacterium]|nr:helix-turn-helix domain-containing protein [Lewinellaceae bacterium]